MTDDLAQSNAEPALPQTLRDAAENLLIAIGMGWDLDGCVENLRTALARSDAEPKHDIRKALEEMLVGASCETTGLEDLEARCCRVCRARAALTQSDAKPEYHPDGRRKGNSRLVYDKEKRTIVPELSRSDAQPVAWQTRAKGSEDWFWHRHGEGKPDIDPEVYEARPLYTAPSHPDASAGLIEAAEMAEQCANGSFSKNEAMYLRGFADRLRTRAADRSGE